MIRGVSSSGDRRSLAWVVHRVRTHSGGQGGAAAVEFALVFPIFVMVTFGMLTGGIAFNQQQSITRAAREGARYGATLPLNGSNNGLAWANEVKDVTKGAADGDLDAAGSTICVALVEGGVGGAPITVVPGTPSYTTDPGGPGGGTCDVNDEVADGSRRVHVKVTRPTQMWAVFMRLNITLHSEAVSKHEQPS
jgi:Flp pilus assembly protein TadG